MATPDWSAVECILSAGRYGYDGVDLRVSEDRGELALAMSPADRLTVRSHASGAGVRIPSLFCYNTVAEFKDAGWTDMRDSLLRHVELAHDVGAESIRIFAGKGSQGFSDADYFARNVAFFLEVLRQFQAAGVRILIQNHRHWASADECFALAEAVNHPFLGIGFSPEHVFCGHQDVREPLSRLGHFVFTYYVADGVLAADGSEFQDGFPGEGDVPLKAYFRQLSNAAPFTGWITFKYEKIWNSRLEDPEAALPKGRSYLSNFLSMP